MTASVAYVRLAKTRHYARVTKMGVSIEAIEAETSDQTIACVAAKPNFLNHWHNSKLFLHAPK